MHLQGTPIKIPKPKMIDKKLGIKNNFHKFSNLSSGIFKNHTQKKFETLTITELLSKKSDLKKNERPPLPLIIEHKKGLKPAIFVLGSNDGKKNLNNEQRKKFAFSASSKDFKKEREKSVKHIQIGDDSLDITIQSRDARIIETPDIFYFKENKKRKEKKNIDKGFYSTSCLPDKY